jgi:hypothetical protein
MAGRSSRYMLKIGRFSAKFPELRFAEICPRRFHSQYPAGYQSCWSSSYANMSATPAWLPGYAPDLIEAASA